MPSTPTATRIVVLTAVTLIAMVTFGTQATAQTIPVVRATAGYGFSDLYGAGFGGSAGLEVPFWRGKRFFVGVRGMHHLGSEGPLPQLGAEGVAEPAGTASQTQVGVEIGATWMSSPFFVRSVGGVGMSRVDVDLESGEADLAGVNYQLQYGPGLLIALPREGGAFTGVEIRWLKVSGLDSALSIYATLGKRLL